MSFKVKRWAEYRNVVMDDFVSGWRSTQHEGDPPTRSYKFPHKGKLLVLGYESDGTPVWTIYDPQTDTIGSVTDASSYVTNWNQYSYFYSWQKSYIRWSNDIILCSTLNNTTHAGGQHFYGWDGWTFKQPTILVPPCNTAWTAVGGPGTHDGLTPNLLSYQYYNGTPDSDWRIVRTTLDGSTTVYNQGATNIYFGTEQGVTYFGMREFGGYYRWYHSDDGIVLYGSIPLDGGEDN